MADDKALRERTVSALLDSAVLSDDHGGAGYSEGMAQNFLGRIGPGRTLDVDYVERIEANNLKRLASVREFTTNTAGTGVKATFTDGKVGAFIQFGTRRKAAEAVQRLEKLKARG